MYLRALKGLGLSLHESAVAAALLERKSARVSELATAVALPRQTVNSILARLVHEGLVLASSGKGVRRYECDYGQLLRYIEERHVRLQNLKNTLHAKHARPVTTHSKRGKLPSVTYYEGAVGLEHLFENMLDMYRKKKTKRFRGYGINFLAQTKGLEDYMRYFLRERHRLGVATDLFIAQGPDDFRITGESARLGRTIKHLAIDEQNAGIYMVGNRLYLFSYKDNVGVMVENQAVAELMKSAFDDHFSKSSE